jgi:hypothetical protein
MRPRHLIIALALLACANSMHAQTLQPKSVTIYKAGIAHVIKTGKLRFNNQTAILDGDIRPLVGTYWLNGEKGISMQFGVDTVKVTRDVGDFYGLLSANKGMHVRIKYLHNKLSDSIRQVAGEIIEYFPGTRMLKLRTKAEAEFVSLANVEILSLSLDGNEKGTFTMDSIYRVAKVFSESKDELQSAELHYVGQGFTWIPSYYIRILDDKNVRMEMKALVENFAEPLIDVETDLVIGTPNLAFGMQLDPIVSGGFDQAFDQQLAQQGMNIRGGRSTSNSMVLSSGLSSFADRDDMYFTQEYAMVGEKSYDLFHYRLGKITIPTQTKAYFPIFAEKVGYEEVYTANIGDHVAFYSSQFVNKETQLIEVNHSLKLKNTTNYPFTTASIVVEDKNSQFLAQDRITYTPQKGDALVNLSRAIDIQLKNTEEELSRDVNYERYNGVLYGRATIKGKVSIRNFQKKSVKVDVSKSLNGEVLSAQSGKFENVPNASVNKTSTIKWQVELDPDESKVVEYTYTVMFQVR